MPPFPEPLPRADGDRCSLSIDWHHLHAHLLHEQLQILDGSVPLLRFGDDARLHHGRGADRAIASAGEHYSRKLFSIWFAKDHGK
jgi:hypothetical protein